MENDPIFRLKESTIKKTAIHWYKLYKEKRQTPQIYLAEKIN